MPFCAFVPWTILSAGWGRFWNFGPKRLVSANCLRVFLIGVWKIRLVRIMQTVEQCSRGESEFLPLTGLGLFVDVFAANLCAWG